MGLSLSCSSHWNPSKPPGKLSIRTPRANRALSLPHLVAAESMTKGDAVGFGLPGRGEGAEERSRPAPGRQHAGLSLCCPPTSLPASPGSPAAWLLLGRKTSLPTMGLSGLEGPSRWGGETALEVLGLGCSGELRANRISLSSSDSILMAFLEHSVWQDFLFWGVTVLQTSYAVGSHRAGLAAFRGAGGVGRDTDLDGRGLWPSPFALLPCRSCLSPHRTLPGPPRTLAVC